MENDIKATVYKQFRLKWQEIGKSAVVAGCTAAVAILYLSISREEFPTLLELKQAGKIGLVTMAGTIMRYFLNPTTTVIQGQVDPKARIVQPDTAVVKDEA